MAQDKLKDIRRPDTFQEWMLRVGDFAAKNVQYFVLAAAVALVVSIAAIVYNWHHQVSEARAQTALYVAEKAYFKKHDQFTEALQDQAKAVAAKSMTKTDSKKSAKSEKAQATVQAKSHFPMPTGNMMEDYGPELHQLQMVIAKHSHTKASVLAALDVADIESHYHHLKKAVEQLRSVQNYMDHHSFLFGVVMMKKANLQSASNDCQQAIQTWAQVLKQKKLAYLHPEATLRSAVCYEDLHNLEKAKELYEQARDRYPGTMAAQSAQKFLRLMSFKATTHNQG